MKTKNNIHDLTDPYEGILDAPQWNGYPAGIRVASTVSREELTDIKQVMLFDGWTYRAINNFIHHLASYVKHHNLTAENRDQLLDHIRSICSTDFTNGQGHNNNGRKRTSRVRTQNPRKAQQPSNSVGEQARAEGENVNGV